MSAEFGGAVLSNRSVLNSQGLDVLKTDSSPLESTATERQAEPLLRHETRDTSLSRPAPSQYLNDRVTIAHSPKSPTGI